MIPHYRFTGTIVCEYAGAAPAEVLLLGVPTAVVTIGGSMGISLLTPARRSSRVSLTTNRCVILGRSWIWPSAS